MMMNRLLIVLLFSMLGLSCASRSINSSYEERSYHVIQEPMVIKGLSLPKGTKVTYEVDFINHGLQDSPLSTDKIRSLRLPKGKALNWAGIPVDWVTKNSYANKTVGYTIFLAFDVPHTSQSRLSTLWKKKRCYRMSVNTKNGDDWSFDMNNIVSIHDCYPMFDGLPVKDEKYMQELFSAMKELATE